MKIICITTMFFMSIFNIGCNTYNRKGSPEEIENQYSLDVLINAQGYSFDDAGGGRIPELFEIEEILSLLQKPGIYQSLINSLDSSVITKSAYGEKNVPLGYVCLDILLSSVPKKHVSTVFYSDCNDDGLWACVRSKY